MVDGKVVAGSGGANSQIGHADIEISGKGQIRRICQREIVAVRGERPQFIDFIGASQRDGAVGRAGHLIGVDGAQALRDAPGRDERGRPRNGEVSVEKVERIARASHRDCKIAGPSRVDISEHGEALRIGQRHSARTGVVKGRKLLDVIVCGQSDGAERAAAEFRRCYRAAVL